MSALTLDEQPLYAMARHNLVSICAPLRAIELTKATDRPNRAAVQLSSVCLRSVYLSIYVCLSPLLLCHFCQVQTHKSKLSSATAHDRISPNELASATRSRFCSLCNVVVSFVDIFPCFREFVASSRPAEYFIRCITLCAARESTLGYLLGARKGLGMTHKHTRSDMSRSRI